MVVRRMRVAMLDPSNFSPPYNDHLCAALAGTGAEVELYSRPSRQHERYSCAGYAVHEHFYRCSEWLSHWSLTRPFYRYVKVLEHVIGMFVLLTKLRRSRPDVIHFQWCALPVLDALFLSSFRRIAPIVLTVHNTKPFHGNPSSWLQGVGYRRILRVFDGLIVHTEQSRRELLLAGCQAPKVTVIPHGVFRSYDIGHVREGIRENTGHEKIILFFGNIKSYKGLDVLLEAFSRVPGASRGDARIVIAGRSSIPPAEIEALVERLGIGDSVSMHLRFLSDQELSVLLANAYMYVFPYKDIDASGALMLAMPYGKPIVASRIGIFSEMLVDGVTALLADANDIDAFATAIERLLTDDVLAKRLGDAVSRLLHDFQSWEDIARHTRKTYQDLIQNIARTGDKNE